MMSRERTRHTSRIKRRVLILEGVSLDFSGVRIVEVLLFFIQYFENDTV